MSNTYQIYLISDSTGETLDRIFLALKAQFKNIEYKIHSIFFYKNPESNNKNFRDSKKK
jgi:regulator of PEP synthase PpsR (kinase-PPPase family)